MNKSVFQVIDGGYYENYGAQTALEIVESIDNLSLARKIVPIVVVISSEAEYRTEEEGFYNPDSKDEEEMSNTATVDKASIRCDWEPVKWNTIVRNDIQTTEFTVPLSGAMNTRAAHGRRALCQLKQKLCTKEVNATKYPHVFRADRMFHFPLPTAKYNDSVQAPLN